MVLVLVLVVAWGVWAFAVIWEDILPPGVAVSRSFICLIEPVDLLLSEPTVSYNEALEVPVVTLSLLGNVLEPEPSVPFSAFDCVRGNVEDPRNM